MDKKWDEECDGFIAKDKHGVYWRGTFGVDEDAVESNLTKKMIREHGMKIVKVKLVEVSDA